MTNLYGLNDNYKDASSHVVAGMIKRAFKAKQDGLNTLKVWGTGTPLRQFCNSEDAALLSLWYLFRPEKSPTVLSLVPK